MEFIVKPFKGSNCCYNCSMEPSTWKNYFENPIVVPDKDKAPLAIYGSFVPDPELVPPSFRPHCIGANIASIYALQLDYDSGMTIDEFGSMFQDYRWSLYTSHSFGFKPGQRFRVVMPLATPLDCSLLQNARVKRSLEFQFPNVDTCCFDRGHFQILPCIRYTGAPYVHIQNAGKKWGSPEQFSEFARWKAEDDLAFERRKEYARTHRKEVDVNQLLMELDEELKEIPVGSGVRYAKTKSLLATYVHKGLGDAILCVDCPWDDAKWQRQWPGLVRWASTLA